jgi:hypothetical protein
MPMKLHDVTRAPNPRRARIFIAEKGLPMPELVQLDLAACNIASLPMRASTPGWARRHWSWTTAR